MLTKPGPNAPDTLRWSNIGKPNSSAIAESIQLSMAPVSTKASNSCGGRSGGFGDPGLYCGSNPICTDRVGPRDASRSGRSGNPQLTVDMIPWVQHGSRQHQRRLSDLPDQVGTPAELSHGVVRRGLKRPRTSRPTAGRGPPPISQNSRLPARRAWPRMR